MDLSDGVNRRSRRRRPATCSAPQVRASRGLAVDAELELGRLLNRKIAGLLAAQDAVDVNRGLPIRIDRIHTVIDQATLGCRARDAVDCGQPVTCRQLDDQLAIRVDEAVRRKNGAAPRLAHKAGNGLLEVGRLANRCRDRFHGEARRRRFDRLQKQPRIRARLRIEHERDLSEWCRNLLQQFDPFGPDRGLQVGESRDVAARMRQTRSSSHALFLSDPRR